MNGLDDLRGRFTSAMMVMLTYPFNRMDSERINTEVYRRLCVSGDVH
jgi:hypothetical protein